LDLAELQAQFGMEGVLEFDETGSGLVFLRITTAAARATVYLHGAHVAEWTPTGVAAVLFLSPRTDLSPGKPIRGGIPVIFPWFGPRSDGQPGPPHGFARTAEWQLAFAAVTGTGPDQQMHLTLTLAPDETSRTLGYDHFRLACRITIGRSLSLELIVANEPDAPAPLVFEEALHTYFAVADARAATVEGLGGTTYVDKRDGMKRKLQPAGAFRLTDTTDRVYLDTTAACTITDDARRIVIDKAGSHTTVVWNPWSEVTPGIADMEPDAWLRMICVETANAGESRITLAPGETHTMRALISVELA
jgi:glucose-6-phosphate 1-epimerase